MNKESVYKRIGILGGTFNPIHLGHLMLAEAAYDKFKLDVVLMMPSPVPPHKSDENIADIRHRCTMTKLAAASNPHLRFSDFELKYDGPSYTALTLKRFKEAYPECEIFFIVGGDSLFSIESWMMPEEIFKQAVILSGIRKGESMGASGNCKPIEEDILREKEHTENPDDELDRKISYLREKYRANIFNLYIPDIDISSSGIIEKLRRGESVRYYMPDEVIDYIYKNNLYMS